MKTSLSKELNRAKFGNYAVPAFNYDNLEMLKAIVEASEELNSPVILMVTESAAKYMGIDYALAIGKQAVIDSKVPTILHLDHAFDFDTIKYAIDNGCDSVMLDASQEPFDRNVNLTSSVVEYAHKKQVEVESEIGHVGGKEDDRDSQSSQYTNINEAQAFENLTKIDALAIAVGTSHGIYKNKIALQFNLIHEINNLIATPLVLHGASGVNSCDLKTAISYGITKVNFGTDLKTKYKDALKQYFELYPGVYDARKFGRYAIDQIKEVVKEKILICQNK